MSDKANAAGVTLNAAVTLISGVGIGIGVAMAALALLKKQREARASTVESIVERCKNAATRLEERLEGGLRQVS